MSIVEVIRKLEEIAADREDILPGCLGWDEAEPLREAIALLKTHPEAQPNEPLTLEELKQMYCQPVWVRYEDGIHGSWGLVELDQITLPAGAYCIIREDSFGTGWKAYRRPPKEEA